MIKFQVSQSKLHPAIVTSYRFKSSASSSRWINRQNNDFYTREAKNRNFKSRAAFKLLQIDEKYNIFKNSTKVLDLGAAPGAWNQVALDRCPKGSTIVGVDILPYDPPIGVSTIQGNILSKMTHKLIREMFLLSELNKRRLNIKNLESVVDKESEEFSELIEIEKIIDELSINKKIQCDNDSSSTSSSVQAHQSDFDIEINRKLNIDKNKLLYPIDVIISDMYVPFPQVTGFNSTTTNVPFFRMANTSGVAIKDHAMSIDLCDAALITGIDLLKKNGHMVMKFFSGSHDKLLEARLRRTFKKVERFKPKACRSESKELYFICLDKKEWDFNKKWVFSAV
ncbi:21S rRNA (uridine2791-2'-O) methyltransferase [Martiniozyma asiatica (nom. inval.)]|nr:21S rRNA (uridine2791-2'-O) methyltransferase [Martiniozyma asiatica]